MLASIVAGIILVTINLYKVYECEELKKRLDIKETENLSLKRAMYENDLIPKDYVK